MNVAGDAVLPPAGAAGAVVTAAGAAAGAGRWRSGRWWTEDQPVVHLKQTRKIYQ